MSLEDLNQTDVRSLLYLLTNEPVNIFGPRVKIFRSSSLSCKFKHCGRTAKSHFPLGKDQNIYEARLAREDQAECPIDDFRVCDPRRGSFAMADKEVATIKSFSYHYQLKATSWIIVSHVVAVQRGSFATRRTKRREQGERRRRERGNIHISVIEP